MSNSYYAELHIKRGDESIRVNGITTATGKEREEEDDPIISDLRIFYEQQPLLDDEQEGRKMRLRLLDWLKRIDPHDMAFDCFSFANALHGEKFPRPIDTSFTLHTPRTGDCKRTGVDPLVGDLVAFYDDKTNQILHFAVCISVVHDLYLSKYGYGGMLGVSSLKSVCRKYGCKFYFSVVKICHDRKCDVTSEILSITCTPTADVQ